LLQRKTIYFCFVANELADLALNFDTKESFLSADLQRMSVQDLNLQNKTGVIGEKKLK